jgi:hypothetical protein
MKLEVSFKRNKFSILENCELIHKADTSYGNFFILVDFPWLNQQKQRMDLLKVHPLRKYRKI